jgi:hypothetical protein
LTQSEQAKCRKCGNSENDAFGDKEGKRVYHCLACNTYLHSDCMSSREWETVLMHDHLEDHQHLESLPSADLELERESAIEQYYKEMQTERTTTSLPPWRCADCTTKQQFAMTRILDLSCTPTGKLMAVVEYMGYTAGELIPVERLIDPANALTDAFKAVLIPGEDAYRTVHYVVTEIQRGETDIPSLMHHGNHRELISLAAMQRRGYCRESCTVFRLMPNVPFFLPLALADIMTDCEGKSLEPIPLQAPPGTNTRRRDGLKRIIGHLTSVTDGALSFPKSLAEGIGGDGRWKGLELINGTRYSDLKQALEDFNMIYGPQQWRELLQRDAPGLTTEDVDWLSTIKEDVRPKRKVKRREAQDDNGKRKRDRGALRDSPGKHRRGEGGALLTNWTVTNRTAATSTLETAKPMETDDNSTAEGRGGTKGQEEHEVLTDGSGTEAGDSESRESTAPSDLARSLAGHRPALQRIKRTLHGHGNAGGLTGKFAALMVWMSMQMTSTEAADPSLFLSDLGEGDGRNKGGRKSQRESLASLQTPRYRQGLLNLTGDGREQGEQGRGDGEGGAEGERRGQPTPRTGIGTVTGGRGREGSHEPKRKAKSERSELSTSQAAGWRQLTLNFGGTGGEGREGGGKQGGRGGSEQRAGTTQDAARPQYGAQNNSTSGNRSQ